MRLCRSIDSTPNGAGPGGLVASCLYIHDMLCIAEELVECHPSRLAHLLPRLNVDTMSFAYCFAGWYDTATSLRTPIPSMSVGILSLLRIEPGPT